MKKAFSITIEEELYEKLKKKCEEENRTISNFIELVLKKLLS